MKNIWFRRSFVVCSTVVLAAIVTLALIPHYSCACGEILKEDGSLLRHLLYAVIEFVGRIVRSIIVG